MVLKIPSFQNNNKNNKTCKETKYDPYIMRDKHLIENVAVETQTLNLLDKDFK